MKCRVTELCDKEVICVRDGCRLGCVDDVEVDTVTSRVMCLVICGRSRCFGLLGREEDIVIPWCDIQVIGEDTILVSCDIPRPRIKVKRIGHFFERMFG